MGGGRKNKGGSSSSNRSRHDQKSSHSQKHTYSTNKHKPTLDDPLRQCLEVEVTSNNQDNHSFSWKQWILLVLILLFVGIICVMAGFLAAGAISIQYYEEHNAVAGRRITSMDGDIHDVLNLLSSEVQELPPLHSQETSSYSSSSSNSSSSSTFVPSPPTIHPTLCGDGVTYGFQDWNTLKAAIHEANRLSAENFLKWNQWVAQHGDELLEMKHKKEHDVSLYYEQDNFMTICPDTTLYARKGPIFINAENIVLECDGCTMDVGGGSHLTFGPHAKNVLVRGITFRNAQTSSLTFYHDGCDAAFEDCYWYGNAGHGKSGAVADVNSTRCVLTWDEFCRAGQLSKL